MKILLTKDRRMPIVGEERPYGYYQDTEPPDRPEDIPEVYGEVVEAIPSQDIRAAPSSLEPALPTDLVRTLVVQGGELVQNAAAPVQALAPQGSPSWLPWAIGGAAVWLIWKNPWLLAAALALPALTRSKTPLSGCRSCQR